MANSVHSPEMITNLSASSGASTASDAAALSTKLQSKMDVLAGTFQEMQEMMSKLSAAVKPADTVRAVEESTTNPADTLLCSVEEAVAQGRRQAKDTDGTIWQGAKHRANMKHLAFADLRVSHVPSSFDNREKAHYICRSAIDAASHDSGCAETPDGKRFLNTVTLFAEAVEALTEEKITAVCSAGYQDAASVSWATYFMSEYAEEARAALTGFESGWKNFAASGDKSNDSKAAHQVRDSFVKIADNLGYIVHAIEDLETL